MPEKIELGESDLGFQQLFRSDDPFDCPVEGNVAGRALGWRFGYELSPEQLASLSVAVGVLGEREVILREIEGERRCWRTDLGPQLYRSLDNLGWIGAVESCLHSPAGTWGALVSFEGHAVFAGSQSFITALKESMAEAREDAIVSMLREWREESWDHRPARSAWIRDLVHHVYGEIAGDRLLMMSGFTKSRTRH